MKLVTPHFFLEEFACKDAVRTPYPEKWIASRLIPLCEVLETIRAAFGRSISITSGYRTPEYNRKVGGAASSQHVQGRAADFKVHGISTDVVERAVLELRAAGKITIGGLGWYPTWNHVDLRPGKRLARWGSPR